MAIYACSDFHGFHSLYKQINDFIKPNDKVIFLGDAADRGPNGWQTVKDILDNQQWIYLMGNHEEMLINYLGGHDVLLHRHNGGKPTEDAVDRDDEIIKNYYATKLRVLPYEMSFKNSHGDRIWLSHSGCISHNREQLTWSRDHWFQDAIEAEYDIVVHGHTPVPYLIKELKTIDKFTNTETLATNWEPGKAYYYEPRNDERALSHTFNLDNLTICTGYTTLLDLDTLQQYSFEVSDEEKKFVIKD